MSQNGTLTKPSTSDLEKIISEDSLSKGAIAKMYNYWLSKSVENADHKREAWKKDLGIDISSEDWQYICTKTHTQSVNVRFRLLQHKWLMRTYITPVQLNKYNRNIPDTCTKCTEAQGTLFQCMWQCNKIQSFWERLKEQ